MPENMVEILDLHKTYRLYDRQQDRIWDLIAPWRGKQKTLTALDGVSFSVAKGEKLGIIGRNGSGKSTLLKIMAGVLTPSAGQARVNGNAAALLELGAGFNHELTGRQNVTTILEMAGAPRRLIKDKIQEIIDFAELKDHIDQPVRVYSSGMFVRLAYATLIVGSPDVLILDEVLAVGDIGFQKKCMDNLQRLCERGATIIWVTHNIASAKSFCDRLLLLNNGELVRQGEPSQVITDYYKIMFPSMDQSEGERDQGESQADKSGAGTGQEEYVLEVTPKKDSLRYGYGGAWVKWVRIHGLQPPNLFSSGQEIVFEIAYGFDPAVIIKVLSESGAAHTMLVGVRVDRKDGVVITDLLGPLTDGAQSPLDINGLEEAVVRISAQTPILRNGLYFFTPGIALGVFQHTTPLAEYSNLIQLEARSPLTVTGLMRWNYDLKTVAHA